MRVLPPILCCAFVLLAGCNRSRARAPTLNSPTAPATIAAESMAVVTESEALGIVKHLSESATVRCDRRDGIIAVVLTVEDKVHNFSFVRGGSFYSLSAFPGVVIVHDEEASNEDSIMVFDSRVPDKPLTLDHDDQEGYVHRHYKIVKGANGQVQLDEYEYAGSSKPRHRAVTIILDGPKVKVKKGTWQEGVE